MTFGGFMHDAGKKANALRATQKKWREKHATSTGNNEKGNSSKLEFGNFSEDERKLVLLNIKKIQRVKRRKQLIVTGVSIAIVAFLILLFFNWVNDVISK